MLIDPNRIHHDFRQNQSIPSILL